MAAVSLRSSLERGDSLNLRMKGIPSAKKPIKITLGNITTSKSSAKLQSSEAQASKGDATLEQLKNPKSSSRQSTMESNELDTILGSRPTPAGVLQSPAARGYQSERSNELLKKNMQVYVQSGFKLKSSKANDSEAASFHQPGTTSRPAKKEHLSTSTIKEPATTSNSLVYHNTSDNRTSASKGVYQGFLHNVIKSMSGKKPILIPNNSVSESSAKLIFKDGVYSFKETPQQAAEVEVKPFDTVGSSSLPKIKDLERKIGKIIRPPTKQQADKLTIETQPAEMMFPFLPSSSNKHISLSQRNIPSSLLAGGAALKEEITALHYYYLHGLKMYHKYFDSKYRHFHSHIHSSFNILKELKSDTLAGEKNKFDVVFRKSKRLILALDLDETLIHCCNFDKNATSCHTVITYKNSNNNTVNARINIRPYVAQFLSGASKYYDIVVFTASEKEYATAIVNYLDPTRRYIKEIFHRDHCAVTARGYVVKDLRMISSSDVHNIVLVDNSSQNFAPQINNGIPIVPYTQEDDDQELLHLLQFLIYLKDHSNVPNCIERNFKLKNYTKYTSVDELLRNIVDDKEPMHQMQNVQLDKF